MTYLCHPHLAASPSLGSIGCKWVRKWDVIGVVLIFAGATETATYDILEFKLYYPSSCSSKYFFAAQLAFINTPRSGPRVLFRAPVAEMCSSCRHPVNRWEDALYARLTSVVLVHPPGQTYTKSRQGCGGLDLWHRRRLVPETPICEHFAAP